MPLPQKSESNWIIGALYKMNTFFYILHALIYLFLDPILTNTLKVVTDPMIIKNWIRLDPDPKR